MSVECIVRNAALMYVDAAHNIFRVYHTANALKKTVAAIHTEEALAEDEEIIQMENAEDDDSEDEMMKM